MYNFRNKRHKKHLPYSYSNYIQHPDVEVKTLSRTAASSMLKFPFGENRCVPFLLHTCGRRGRTSPRACHQGSSTAFRVREKRPLQLDSHAELTLIVRLRNENAVREPTTASETPAGRRGKEIITQIRKSAPVRTRKRSPSAPGNASRGGFNGFPKDANPGKRLLGECRFPKTRLSLIVPKDEAKTEAAARTPRKRLPPRPPKPANSLRHRRGRMAAKPEPRPRPSRPGR